MTAGSLPVSSGTSNDGAQVTPLCFLPDTLIRTPAGQTKVQNLRPGDTVTTLEGAERKVVWVGHGKVLATRGRRGPATPVVTGGPVVDAVWRRLLDRVAPLRASDRQPGSASPGRRGAD